MRHARGKFMQVQLPLDRLDEFTVPKEMTMAVKELANWLS